MTLPGFNQFGDLPPGVHVAPLAEVLQRFGSGTKQRVKISGVLREIVRLAQATTKVASIIVFGSFVSEIDSPNDVDVILVMSDDFVLEDCPQESLVLFDHERADRELRASIFWIRPNMLLGQPIEDFVAFWQTKRDGRRRGIVEIQT